MAKKLSTIKLFSGSEPDLFCSDAQQCRWFVYNMCEMQIVWSRSLWILHYETAQLCFCLQIDDALFTTLHENQKSMN